MKKRNPILGGLLIAALVLLATELLIAMPRAFEWHPFDYGNYVAMGRAVRQGINPYTLPHSFYPLPTILWIFVPPSLLPDWFRFTWILIPFISILLLFQTQGIWLFLFAPVWFALGDGMLDGVLLLPLAWLLSKRAKWTALGAAILLFKPHVAILPLLYCMAQWCVKRDWTNIRIFSSLVALFMLPAFLLNPAWPLEMIQALGARADQNLATVPLLTSSLWSWWWLGGMAQFVFLILSSATGVVVWQAIRQEGNRSSMLQLLNLLWLPVLFASSLILAIPTLRGRNQILIVVLLS